MKSFALAVLSISCCFVVVIHSAAVETKVVELQKDTTESSTSVKELSTNEDCIQPTETGRCFALFYRFAYDVEKRECVEFIYGGCAGNSNNFKTKEDCEVKCMKNHETSSENVDEMAQTTLTPAILETETTTTMAADSA